MNGLTGAAIDVGALADAMTGLLKQQSPFR